MKAAATDVWKHIELFGFAMGMGDGSGVNASLKPFLKLNWLHVAALQPGGWGAYLVALVIVSILVIVYIIWQKLRRRLREQQEQIDRQRDQIAQMTLMLKMKILRARMNPHFLFNSLNAVQYFINADDKKTSLQYISRFASFLRKMIHFGDDIAVTLRDEAELISDYLVLEQSRFPDRFTYEIELPEALWLEDIPPFFDA